MFNEKKKLKKGKKIKIYNKTKVGLKDAKRNYKKEFRF